MQVTLNIQDKILEKFRLFKIKNKQSDPRYLILDKLSYFALKEQYDVPDYEDIATYGGWMIALDPSMETKIEFI